jgi:O-antigen ligase
MRPTQASTEFPGEAAPLMGLLSGTSSSMEWGRLMLLLVTLAWAASPFVGFMRALAFLTILGFGATLFGFGRPGLGALGVTLSCTLDPLARHFLLTTGGFLRWNTFNYLLLLCIVASAAFVFRVSDLNSRLLKAFVVLLAAGLVISPDVPNGVQHVLGIATLFGILVCLAPNNDDPDMWYMVGLVNGVAGALGGLAFWLLKDALPLMNTNAWALFPETAVFATCLGFRYAAGRRGGQIAFGALAGANAMWTFLSGSRGGILIVSVGLLFIVITMKRMSHRLVFIATALVMATLILGAFGDQESFALHRINKMLDDDESAVSRTNGRSDLALAGVYMVRHAPLGVGTGGFAPTWASLGFVPGLSTFKRGEEFQAHSAWIKILAENGWPGLLLMVAYVGSFAVAGFRSQRPGDASLGALVTAALAVSFLSTEFQGKTVWFLAAGATAQLHPQEMSRCVRAQIERFVSRPRRLLNRSAAVTPARSEESAFQ